MKTVISFCAMAALTCIMFCRCTNAVSAPAKQPGASKSFAIYTEFARGENKQMKDSTNRRVFNDTTVQIGTDISLGHNGVISLKPGTYHISGFSMVTMETNMPTTIHDHNYPGYAMVYREADEKRLPQKSLGVGNVAASDYFTPSTFDLVFSCDTVTSICVAHQSGWDFLYPIYLTLYKTDAGEVSEYHAFARIAIEKLY